MQVFSQRSDKPHAYQFGETDNTLAVDPIEFAISPDGINWVSYYDRPELQGIYLVDHNVANANPVDEYVRQGIQDGQTHTLSAYDMRDIKCSFFFTGLDDSDVKLAYSRLQSFLFSRDPYWICFADWPERMYYVKAKPMVPNYIGDNGFTVEQDFNDVLGMSRTVLTSNQFKDGQDYTLGNDFAEGVVPEYEFSTASFNVKNYSDVMIDPERRGHPLKIQLSGSSNGAVTVKNTTTGDEITRNSAFNGTWELRGVNPYLNNSADGINTDHGMISLQKGDNQFSVTGFTGTISIDFPFWYLS